MVDIIFSRYFFYEHPGQVPLADRFDQAEKGLLQIGCIFLFSNKLIGCSSGSANGEGSLP